MNILNNTFRATWIATPLFWIMMSNDVSNTGFLPFWFMSTIPIFLCCLTVILFTIYPFFILESNRLSNKEIFNKYFPYWVIVVFGICLFSIDYFGYHQFAISFFTTAFFTTLFVWAWSSKTVKKESETFKNKDS